MRGEAQPHLGNCKVIKFVICICFYDDFTLKVSFIEFSDSFSIFILLLEHTAPGMVSCHHYSGKFSRLLSFAHLFISLSGETVWSRPWTQIKINTHTHCALASMVKIYIHSCGSFNTQTSVYIHSQCLIAVCESLFEILDTRQQFSLRSDGLFSQRSLRHYGIGLATHSCRTLFQRIKLSAKLHQL